MTGPTNGRSSRITLMAFAGMNVIGLSIGVLQVPPERPTSDEKPLRIEAHVVRPDRLPADEAAMWRLRVPDGFEITRFATGLGKPRMLAVAGDGRVYVTRREEGDVLLLDDPDGDGRADTPRIVARRPGAHGIAIRGDEVYIATVREVLVGDLQPDGSIGPLRTIIGDLPDGGQHPNRTLAFGPDGMLYISAGSTCNACPEPNPEHATLLRAAADGSSRSIFASGLRNTIGFDWHPETGELFGMDHGIDWLGDDEPKEELNRIAAGEQYGWPFVYADGRFNPLLQEPPGETSREDWAAMSQEPVLLYTAHAAPMQMAFYTGDAFPESYRHDAFVAMHGSWNRLPPSGYEVVRIRFGEDGQPEAIEPFLTGFLVTRNGSWGQFGRPAGIAVARDGSLLVSDDGSGVIYRVTYKGNGAEG